MISVLLCVFLSSSLTPFLRVLCGFSSSPLNPPIPYPSVCLLLLVLEYPSMLWQWQCALLLLSSASLGMLGGNDLFHDICSRSSVDLRRTLMPCVLLWWYSMDCVCQNHHRNADAICHFVSIETGPSLCLHIFHFSVSGHYCLDYLLWHFWG